MCKKSVFLTISWKQSLKTKKNTRVIVSPLTHFSGIEDLNVKIEKKWPCPGFKSSMASQPRLSQYEAVRQPKSCGQLILLHFQTSLETSDNQSSQSLVSQFCQLVSYLVSQLVSFVSQEVLGGLPNGGHCELYIFDFFISIPQGPLGTTPGTIKGNPLLV